MGYPKDLDEYTELQLTEELLRREELQKQELCDYCERESSTRNCKFPNRHHWNHPNEVIKRALLKLLPYYDVHTSGCIVTQAIEDGESTQSFSMQRRRKPGKPQYAHKISSWTRIEDLKISKDMKRIDFTLNLDPKFYFGKSRQ